MTRSFQDGGKRAYSKFHARFPVTVVKECIKSDEDGGGSKVEKGEGEGDGSESGSDDEEALKWASVATQRREKRGAVRVYEYETDSSEGGLDYWDDERRRRQRQKRNNDSTNDEGNKEVNEEASEDEDMFATGKGDSEEDGYKVKPRNEKRRVRFVKADKLIEKEEQDDDDATELARLSSEKNYAVHCKAEENSTERGGSSAAGDEDEDDEGNDEDRARLDHALDPELGAGAKRKNAPRLDAFNMKAEEREGVFDEDGNFLRKAIDSEREHDIWLEGVSKREIRIAREAQEKRRKSEREQDRKEDEIVVSELIGVLIKNLNFGETPVEALAKLGRAKEPFMGRNRWAKKKTKVKQCEPVVDSDKVIMIKRQIEEVTHAASLLLVRGFTQVYESEREILMRWFERETGEIWKDAGESN